MENRLLSYVYFFNVKRDYFECHEYGESLWLDCGRPEVLKGLIQAAICLYHLQNGNVRGGYSMWLRAHKYLIPYLPTYESIDLVQLCGDIDKVFACVPKTWYDQIRTPKEIADLHLPVVYITIHDTDLYAILETFVPVSLEESK